MSPAQARLAGLLYVVLIVAGLFSLAYVPSQVPLSDAANAQEVLARVRAGETLWRWGVAADLVQQVTFVLLALALARPLYAAGPALAVSMVALVVVAVPVALSSLAGRLDLLALAQPGGMALAPDALAGAVTAALRRMRSGLLVAQLFWGLWLAPMAVLLWRTRAVPRVLALCLALGCAGYVLRVFAIVLMPEPAEWATGWAAVLPASVGEIGSGLWLLLAPNRWRRQPGGTLVSFGG